MKVPKIKNPYKEASNQIFFYKIDPPKSGISYSNTISKFSKTKNQTEKRPPKFQKIKDIYKEASNQKVL